MFSFIDQKKFYQLGVGMLGVMSIYLIYGVIYEQSIGAHYVNQWTGEKEVFKSETGFVLLEQTFSWVLVEIFAFLLIKKEANVKIPHKYTLTCGVLSSASCVLFTYTIFQLSFISSMLHKAMTFSMVCFVGILFGGLCIKQRDSRRVDFALSKGILMGGLFFWIYAQQTWFFSENKNGHIFAYITILSDICDAFLALGQKWIAERYQPTEIQLFLNVSRWTVFSTLIFTLITGDLLYTIEFFIKHHDFAFTILSLSALYFVGQFFLYRITVKMTDSVPLFIVATRSVMMVHESYALSRHKLNHYQVLGMCLSWGFILLQVLRFCRKQKLSEDENCQQVSEYTETQQMSTYRRGVNPI